MFEIMSPQTNKLNLDPLQIKQYLINNLVQFSFLLNKTMNMKKLYGLFSWIFFLSKSYLIVFFYETFHLNTCFKLTTDLFSHHW